MNTRTLEIKMASNVCKYVRKTGTHAHKVDKFSNFYNKLKAQKPQKCYKRLYFEFY